MTDLGPTVLLIDPMSDVAAQLEQIEDWLAFADTDDEDLAETVRAGAAAAGDLTVAVRQASQDRVVLWSPQRTELAPALLIDAHPLPALRTAADVLVHRTARSRHVQVHLDALYLLGRCAEQYGTPDHDTLAAVLVPAAPARTGVWLAAAQFAAYQRYCQTVLKDPLDQLAAGI
jgi:hypothetical protein